MVREIKVVLNNPTTLTTGNNFRIKIELLSEFQTITSNFIFVNSSLPPNGWSGESVGAFGTSLQIITNLYNAAVARYAAYSFINVVQNADGISINVTLDNVTSSTVDVYETAPGTIVITHQNIVVPEPPAQAAAILLSRSPQFVEVSPNAFFDQARMDLRIYRGHETDDYPVTPSFSLSKTVVQAGQEKIVFDIQAIINDYVKNSMGVFADGAQTTSFLDSVWVKADIDIFFLGETIGNIQRAWLAVDGFGYHVELYNPVISQNVLSSIDRHIVYSGSDYPLYFKTHDLTSITVNGQDVPFTFDPEYNNQAISYVNVMTYADGDENFTAELVYGSGDTEQVIKHFFTVKNECKYDVKNCFFKNKFGFWQSIPFSKLSRSTIDTSSEEYEGIISNFGQYALNEHVKKTYLTRLSEKISANTDYIPEHYNALFVELLASEFVYMVTNEGPLPVKLVKKSFTKKTRVNDKLIQYAMDFEYAFNLINTVK